MYSRWDALNVKEKKEDEKNHFSKRNRKKKEKEYRYSASRNIGELPRCDYYKHKVINYDYT